VFVVTKKLFKMLIPFLLISILLIFNACSIITNKNNNSDFMIVSHIESAESMTSKPSGDYPYVTGSFIQPFALMNLSQDRIAIHLSTLKEVGIDTIILQWSAITPNGIFQDVYYPSENSKTNHTDNFTASNIAMIENLLSAAEKLGMKVFIGLNNADEWWNFGPTNKAWNEKQAETGLIIAQEIYDLYKIKYPNALHGWYYVWEMSNGNIIKWPQANGELLNLYLNGLTKIDSSMPMMLSPFICEVDGSAEQTGNKLKEMLEVANFRNGDIYCSQDSIGAGYMSIDKLDKYFSAINDAIKNEVGLQFWANNENFIQATWSAASIDRFVAQLKIASKYVTGYVTFSYSHYYSPDFASTSIYHEIYKKYYLTGNLPIIDCPSTPEIAINIINGRDAIAVSMTIMQNTYGIKAVEIFINDKLIDTITNDHIESNSEIKLSSYINLSDIEKNESIQITAIAYDLNKNKSQIGKTEYTKIN